MLKDLAAARTRIAREKAAGVFTKGMRKAAGDILGQAAVNKGGEKVCERDILGQAAVNKEGQKCLIETC